MQGKGVRQNHGSKFIKKNCDITINERIVNELNGILNTVKYKD